jgi:hypothetical protein
LSGPRGRALRAQTSAFEEYAVLANSRKEDRRYRKVFSATALQRDRIKRIQRMRIQSMKQGGKALIELFVLRADDRSELTWLTNQCTLYNRLIRPFFFMRKMDEDRYPYHDRKWMGDYSSFDCQISRRMQNIGVCGSKQLTESASLGHHAS